MDVAMASGHLLSVRITPSFCIGVDLAVLMGICWNTFVTRSLTLLA